MATRILRDGILSSERVNGLSLEGELFFRRLMSVVDDYGRYPALPALLRAGCFPLRLDAVTEADVLGWLGECEALGLLSLYAVGAKRFLEVCNFGQRMQSAARYPGRNGVTEKKPERVPKGAVNTGAAQGGTETLREGDTVENGDSRCVTALVGDEVEVVVVVGDEVEHTPTARAAGGSGGAPEGMGGLGEGSGGLAGESDRESGGESGGEAGGFAGQDRSELPEGSEREAEENSPQRADGKPRKGPGGKSGGGGKTASGGGLPGAGGKARRGGYKRGGEGAPELRPLPEDFAISAAVRAWAKANRVGRLEVHFEYFVGFSRARGALYADWDQALMNAIRDNWARLPVGSGAAAAGSGLPLAGPLDVPAGVADFWSAAGFAGYWEAVAAGCEAGNAGSFRAGVRVAAGGEHGRG